MNSGNIKKLKNELNQIKNLKIKVEDIKVQQI